MSELHINGADLLKIKVALEEGKPIAGMRVMGGRACGGGVATFTMSGRGWTLYANTLARVNPKTFEQLHRVFGLNLIGDRERFEEDFILGKMTVA